MLKVSILSILFFICVHDARAQDDQIDPERPDQSSSPGLLAKNAFEAEFGFNKNNNSSGDYDLLYPTSLLRYGAGVIELRLAVNIMKSYQRMIPTPLSESGFSPVSLGFKVNLWKEKKGRPETSVIAGFGIPFLASRVFRADHLAPSIILAMQNNFSQHADLTYNIGAVWDGFSKTPAWIYTLSQDFSFATNWNVYIELFGSIKENESPQHNIDAGLGYCITNNAKVDISGGLGLSKESPESFVAIGFSFRLLPHAQKK